MLKKAKIAFLLVIALVFAVQGIGMESALAAVEQKVWTADEVIYANLLEGLGEAAATGLVAETYNQSSHSEANVIADKVIRRSEDPFLISGRANASMPFNLVVSVELPIFHLADTMTFGLYTKNGDDYTYTGISQTVNVEGKEEVEVDFGRITDDDLRFHELYVFQIENNNIVEEGTMNSDAMVPEYGPPATTGVDGVIYIGAMEYNLPQNRMPSSECKIFQEPDAQFSTETFEGTISKVEFGPSIKLYKKTENGYEQLPDSAGKVYENGVLVDSNEAVSAVDKVYIRDDSWPTTYGDQGYLQLMYVTHNGSSYILYGEHEITVSYKTAGKAKELLDDLANLSYNLANSELGIGGTSIQGPGGAPLATGGSTVTGTVTDGKVVSLYTVPVENNVVQARKYLDAASQEDGNRQTNWTNQGLPIAENEYIVINVVVPAGTDYIDFTTDASNVSLYNGNGDTDKHGDWGNGEPLSFGRLIWNPVTWNGSAYVPYTGKVYVGGGGAGIYLAPNSVQMSNMNPNGTSGTTANACTLISREVYQGGQEIHQTSFDSSSTYVRMTNRHDTDVSGKKTWNDAGHENKRPVSIEVTLYAETYGRYQTSEVVKTIKVTEADGWAWSFEGLPKYDQYGNTLYYRVEEKLINNYAAQTSPNWEGYYQPVYNLNITNTYDETQIVVEGKKIWDDANNQDGKRPTSITVELQARYKKASESNWSNWEKLSAPKYNNLYEYGNYYSSIFSGITDTLTVNADDNWEWNFGGLKTKYWVSEYRHNQMPNYIGETDWEYRVVEIKFGDENIHDRNNLAENGSGDIKYNAGPGNQVDTGYDVTYMDDSYDIKNSYTPETIDLSGKKEWVPSTVSNKTEVTINLYIVNADGTETDTGLTAKANEGNNWTWSFTGLDKYSNGEEIQYTVKENNAPQGFWSEVSEDGSTVYNIAKDVKLNGTKVWKDQNGNVTNAPNSANDGVQIEVYRWQDDKLMATQTVSSWTNWAWSVELPGLMPDGRTEAKYYVKEVFEPNYISTPVEGESGEEGHYKVLNWTVTNTHVPISIKVTKVWSDDENESGMRPAQLNLYLKRRTDSSQNWQNATDSNGQQIVAVLDVANGQTEYTFTNLPEYDDNGNKYEYYVEELTSSYQPPVGYTPSYETKTDDKGNIDYTLTNTINKVSISGTKTWSGLGDRETHPTSVNLKVMYHNGTENVVYTTKEITGGARENSWNWTISDLPEYINGQKVTYTVEEEAVFGYDSSVSGDMTNGFTVTNTKKEVGRIRLYKESDSETEDRRVNNEWKRNLRKRLDGAVFRVYSDEDCQNEVLTDHEKYPFTTASTGSEKGKLTIENVPYGTYWLKEVTPPGDYTLYGDGVYKVVVNGETADVEGDAINQDNNTDKNVVLNKKITGDSGSIALTKTDADTGEKLSGAVFTVYSDEACNTSVGSMTEDTNNKGVYTMSGLTAGTTYFVKETAAPTTNAGGEAETYQLDSQVYTVTVEANTTKNVADNKVFSGTDSDKTITNKAVTAVSVTKVWEGEENDADGMPAFIDVTVWDDEYNECASERLSAANNWSAAWDNLPKYRYNAETGTKETIVYTVDEDDPPVDYVKKITSDGNFNYTITNTYIDQNQKLELTIPVAKSVVGGDIDTIENAADKTFEFALAQVSDPPGPLPEEGDVTASVTGEGDVTDTFGKIVIPYAMFASHANGTPKTFEYSWLVSETKGSNENIIYDDHVYRYWVTVALNEDGKMYLADRELHNWETGEITTGKITIEKYQPNGESYGFFMTDYEFVDSVAAGVNDRVTFTNTYFAPVPVSLSARKTLNDADYSGTDYTFVLKQGETLIESVSKVEDGEVTFAPIQFTLADMKNTDGTIAAEKTFTYTISEVEGSAEDVTYDETIYTAEVTVKCNVDEGTLSSTVVYKKDGAEYNDTPLFDNRKEAEKTSVSVTKVWENVEGITLPESVEVKLYNTNNTEGTLDDMVVGTATLPDQAGNWSYTWTDLDKYVTGTDTEIIYRVDEVAVPGGYYKTVEAKDNVFTITNTLAEGNYDIEIDKTLLHASDLTEAKTFTFELYKYKVTSAEGQPISGETVGDAIATKDITISATTENGQDSALLEFPLEYGENWFLLKEKDGGDASIDYAGNQYIIMIRAAVDMSGNLGTNDLPLVYDKDGKQIADEETSCDYAFENTYNATTTVSVTKVWDDNTNEANKRPENIQVQLLNGEDVMGTVTLPYEGNWSYTWTDLDKYDTNGDEITYTVAEITKAADGETDLPWVADYIPGVPAGSMDAGYEITNSYVSVETEITLTKKLDGQPSATEFDFTLTPKTVGDKNQATTAKNNETGGIVFSLEYGKDDMGKTYVYEIAETAKEGYYCDSTVYTVTVAVGAEINADGTLPLTVTYKKGSETVAAADLVFENASAITAKLPVAKTLTTNSVDDVAKTYSFTLTPTYQGATEAVQTINVTVAGTASPLTGSAEFELSFAAPGTYTYTVAETVASQLPGYTYDESVYNVTYQVEMANGKLQVAAGYPEITLNGTAADKLAFTNDYEQEAGSATLHANKVFTNGTLTDGQFTFVLLAADGTTPVTDADGKAITAISNALGEVTFPALHYDVAGTYNYVIKEQIPADQGGIVYDGKSENVTVTVEAKDGKLEAAVKYNGSDTVPTFINEQLSATGTVYVKKNFADNKTAAGDYTFTMMPVDNAPELANNTLTLTFGDTTTDARGVFQLPTYMEPGTYEYIVKESTTNKDVNIEYDRMEYTITVTVTRVGGELVATVASDDVEITETAPIVFTNKVLTTSLSGTKVWVGDKETDRPESITIRLLANGKETGDICELAPTETEWSFTDLPVNDEEGEIVYTVSEDEVPGYVTVIDNTTNTITNTKIADGEAVLQAKKVLNGDATLVADQFTFVLKNAKGEIIDTKKNNADGIVTFDKLTYTEVKDHTYTIEEVLPKEATEENNYTVNGMTYDAVTRSVKVAVTQDTTTHTLKAAVTYDGGADVPVFTNTYKVTGTTLDLSLSKTLTNSAKLPDGRTETFKFILADEAGATKDEVEVNFTNASDETQTVSFDKLTFDKEGTFNYTISEISSTANDIISDTTKYFLEVKVEDVDGQLVATKTLTSQTAAEEKVPATGIEFTNTYDTDKVGELTLDVTKAMSGREFQSGDSFTFTVTGSDGTPMPEKTSVTITPTSGATAAVDFGKIEYTEDDLGKTYTYTVQETIGTLAGVTYDTTAYTVEVTISEGTDELIATPAYANGGKITITNTYNANGKLLLTGSKQVTGDSTVDQHTFSFAVYDGETVKATGTNDETGKITFTEIAYTLDQAGTYLYTVKEVPDENAVDTDKYSVTFDATEYQILVNVQNNAATGELDVTWSINSPANAAALEFTNAVTLRVGNIGVLKVDSKDTAKGLSGAQFTVYTDEGCAEEDILVLPNGTEAVITTGSTGAGYLSGLPIGTYWVKETKAPDGYVMEEGTTYEVEIVDDGDIAMVNDTYITNKKLARLELEKSDRLNPEKKLPGAEYTLYTDEKCEDEDILELPDGTKGIITTGETGVGALDGVPPGIYWVKETKAPTGYEIDPIPYKVIVEEGTDPAEPVVVRVSDCPLRGALALSKTVVANTEVDDSFLFDIELAMANGDPIVGSYEATLNGVATDAVAFTATDTGAKATVELKDGDTLTIFGLRSGVTYTVTEQANSRYEVQVNGANAVTATGIISDVALSIVKYQNTLKQTGFTVEKIWQGEDAGEIKLTLYANGVAMNPQPVVTREGNTYTYADLVMNDETGKEIVYTVKETAMAGYTTSYENAAPYADKTECAYNGGKIINQALTSFSVKKEWTGLAEGETAPAIQLTLYCNGTVYTAATPKPDQNGWYTYTNLPSMVDGQAAVYTVKEEPVSGFTTTYLNKGENAAVTDCAYNGSTIVNSKIPQTGDSTPLALWMLTTLLAACGLAAVTAIARKREN